MDVLERIEKGELSLDIFNSKTCQPSVKSEIELLWLAKLGKRMQWIDGVPPVFGVNERKWIIFEHLTPFTKATVYDTAVWLGKFYSQEKVKLALRWALLPLPPSPKEAE